MPRGRTKWFLKDGVLHCRQCGLRAADQSRGKEHSQCWCDPGKGFGQPESCQEPLVLTHYGSSELAKLFENHIARWDSDTRAMLRALRAYNRRYFEVLLATREGERMSDYARRVGIPRQTAYTQQRRAREWARRWIVRHQAEVDARRDADRAAWEARHPTEEREAEVAA